MLDEEASQRQISTDLIFCAKRGELFIFVRASKVGVASIVDSDVIVIVLSV